jgi:uncharacterized protein (DUF2141 family)
LSILSLAANGKKEKSRKGNEMKRHLHGIRCPATLALLSCALLAISTERLTAQSQAQPAAAQTTSTLTVHVLGLRNATGTVRLTLYRDSKPVETRNLEIEAKTLSAKTVFEKLPQGIYAVYLFHDENSNGKMDTNFFGMPVEGYGMSNNPPKKMGRPGFDETNFQLNRPEAETDIKLIYW